MPEFLLHPDTGADLLRISSKSPTARGRILAALEAVSEDENLLDHLQSNNYRTYGDQDTDVKRWVLASKLGNDIYRFRFFYLEENGYHYRVVYAIDNAHDECHILAILRRDEIDYDDPEHEFNVRIFNAYSELGL